MKELVVIPEAHAYGNVALLEHTSKKLDEFKKGATLPTDLFALELLSKYGIDGYYRTLCEEIKLTTWGHPYKITKKTPPDTLFLEMVEDTYLEKACEHFNKTHDVEKVFEALSSHFLAYWIQENFNFAKKYEAFYDKLSEAQKKTFMPPSNILAKVLVLKRALYRRWHNSFIGILSVVTKLYFVKTGDTKAMVRQILKSKQFFERAVIICGLNHAVDFFEMKNLFKRNGIELKWPNEGVKELMAEVSAERRTVKND